MILVQIPETGKPDEKNKYGSALEFLVEISRNGNSPEIWPYSNREKCVEKSRSRFIYPIQRF